MTLNIAHRPDSLGQMVGNDGTVRTLGALLERIKKFPHAILITGPTGCGKTTLGRIIADELDSYGIDFKEMDTAEYGGVDTVRDLRKGLRMRCIDPRSKRKVYLLDECHGLTSPAQNALLKALEDAPDNVYFILCTTDPQKLLPTVKGRCTPLSVAPLSDKETEILLRRVCKAEKVKLPKDIRVLIAEQSFGHPRNALQLLSKVIGLKPEEMADVVEEEAAKLSAAIDLCRSLMNAKKWKTIADILVGLKKEDQEGIRHLVLGYCNSILLKSDNAKAFLIMEEFEEPFYNTGKPGLTLACYRALMEIKG